MLVIDEDLGRSGTRADDRTGFQRLVLEVSLDHVGLILGVEMSRLARTLERRWEEELTAQRQLEEAYHRVLDEQPRTLSEPERAAIRRLAADIPALWAAPTTTDADRKELIRQAVERVVVQAQGASERVWVRVDWVGGEQTQGMVRRPIRQLADLSGYAQICERVRTWTHEGSGGRKHRGALGPGGLSAAARRTVRAPGRS